jgi:ABC-2 type transport system permease protein
MLALVGSGMAKYAAYHQAGQSIVALIDQLPRSIQILFGLTGFDLTKASGFFGVLFLYIALMGTIHALLTGTDMISKEERDKTAEFLFVKPISRARVISMKLLAGIVNLILINLVTFVSSLYFVNYFSKEESVTRDISVLMGGLFMLQLIFFSVGMAMAAAGKRPKTSASRATSVLLVTFMLSYLIDFNTKLDGLKYLTPFKYFDAKTLLAAGRLDPAYVLISLIIIAALVLATYFSYTKRDLSV